MATLVHGERVGKTAKLSLAVSGFVFTANLGKVLLVRRTDNGRWCLPSGRIEPGETCEEAVAREVLEETGLQVIAGRVIGVWSDPNIISTYPDGNRWQTVEIDIEARVIGGALTESDETDRLGYFGLSDLGTLDLMETETERVRRALLGQVPYIN